MQEALERDTRLFFEPDKHDWYFPMPHRYQLRLEFPLNMSAQIFTKP